jgi:hypothetical protein
VSPERRKDRVRSQNDGDCERDSQVTAGIAGDRIVEWVRSQSPLNLLYDLDNTQSTCVEI